MGIIDVNDPVQHAQWALDEAINAKNRALNGVLKNVSKSGQDAVLKPYEDRIAAAQQALATAQTQKTTQASQQEAEKRANDPAYAAQQDLVTQMQNRISGKEKSASEIAAEQAKESAEQSAASAAASARGRVNPAMLQKALLQQNAQVAQQAGQMAQAGKQQELSQYAQMLQGVRSGELQGQQLSQQQQQFLQQLQQQYAQLEVQKQLGMGNLGVAQTGQTMTGIGSLMGGLSGLAALLPLLSDETKKKDIKEADKDIYEFLDALSSSKYKYKDKKFGPDEYYSPMAQELEETPVGASMVMETPNGKMVDYGRGFGAILAAQSALHKRLKDLEDEG